MIKNKVEVPIIGLVKKITFMRDSLRQVKGMAEVRSIGLMEVGIKGTLRMGYSVVRVCCIGMVAIKSIKETGIMECLMAREYSFSIMVRGIKDLLRRISFMETASFIRMTQLFMASGRITSCRLLIWLNPF